MSRPDSFTNAMRGPLDPEAAAIDAYVASLEADAARLDADVAEIDRLLDAIQVKVAALRVDFETLQRLGGHLANAAYNISQYVGQPLSDRAATSLRRAYEEWDRAISRLGAP